MPLSKRREHKTKLKMGKGFALVWGGSGSEGLSYNKKTRGGKKYASAKEVERKMGNRSGTGKWGQSSEFLVGYYVSAAEVSGAFSS